MGNVTKKSFISGLVWIRGSLGENQPTFQVVVNKPITLAQGEQIAMLLKTAVDDARAQLAAQKESVGKPIDHVDHDACVVHDESAAATKCECNDSQGVHHPNCPAG